MIEIDHILLEDNLEYIIIDEIVIEEIKYIFLVNEEKNKTELRKLDDNNNLLLIKNDEEYQKAMVYFAKKHRNDFI